MQTLQLRVQFWSFCLPYLSILYVVYVVMDCVWKALCNALDEEDSLANELEKEQQAALESAMLQEESYLQEIAREQSTEIQVDTEPDTEHEDHSAAVSFLSLHWCIVYHVC